VVNEALEQRHTTPVVTGPGLAGIRNRHARRAAKANGKGSGKW